jgi:hypothetical protein
VSDDVKAKLTRSEASSSNKAKAKVRPSSVVIKKAPEKKIATKPAKLVKPVRPAAPASAARVSSVGATRGVASAAAKGKPNAAAKVVGSAQPPAAAAPASSKRALVSSKRALVTKAKPTSLKAAATPPAAPAKSAAATSVASIPPPSKKAPRKSIKEAAGVSTDAVARRTGKTWDDWFEVLDSAGAQTLDQRGIIAILAQKHGIGPWWQQMIAVGYESLRSKAEKPPVADGFQINSNCTLDAPVTRVFRLWNDPGERARWLSDERFVVRAATTDKAIRARWGKGNSHVAVSFSERSGKTEVNVEHHQIESRSAADQMKAYWSKKLGLLDEALAQSR